MQNLENEIFNETKRRIEEYSQENMRIEVKDVMDKIALDEEDEMNETKKEIKSLLNMQKNRDKDKFESAFMVKISDLFKRIQLCAISLYQRVKIRKLSEPSKEHQQIVIEIENEEWNPNAETVKVPIEQIEKQANISKNLLLEEEQER